jgi:hypothetical protein
MVGKIRTMEDVRDYASDALEKLAKGEIDTAQAGATGKLCESIVSTVKSQYEYARMLNEVPHIPFVDDCHKPKHMINGELEHDNVKSLPAPKSKYK